MVAQGDSIVIQNEGYPLKQYVTPICNLNHKNAPNKDTSSPPHSNAIQPSFKRRPHKVHISPYTALKPNKTKGVTAQTQKKATGANPQPSDVNHTQTHAPVYTLKSKLKLNQCKRFVLSQPIEPSHLTRWHTNIFSTPPLYTSFCAPCLSSTKEEYLIKYNKHNDKLPQTTKAAARGHCLYLGRCSLKLSRLVSTHIQCKGNQFYQYFKPIAWNGCFLKLLLLQNELKFVLREDSNLPKFHIELFYIY